MAKSTPEEHKECRNRVNPALRDEHINFADKPVKTRLACKSRLDSIADLNELARIEQEFILS